MRAKTNSIDMVNGPLWGKMLKFAAFLMATSLLQNLYSAADTIVVGRYAGKAALAGVGTCTPLVNMFINFVGGLSGGASVTIGHAIGAGDRHKISQAAHTAIALALFGGLAVSVIFLSFTVRLLSLISVPEDVMPQATAYLRVLAIGFVPSLLYNFGAGILRAKGDSKRSLYIVSISGVINLLLNLFTVCVLKMGAAGVAAATVASQIFTAVAVLWILFRETDETKITLKGLRISKEPFLKIVKYGLPLGFQSVLYAGSNALVQSSVNSFGSAAIAGNSVATSITGFYRLTGYGLAQTALIFSSQNFGAKQFDRMRKILRICLVYLACSSVLYSAITVFCGEFLVRLYAPNDPAVLEMAWRKLRFVGHMYFFSGYWETMSCALRSMGKSFVNMMVSLVGVCGIRIVWILTAFKAIGTYESLFVCYPLSWFGTGLMFAAMFAVTFHREKKRHEQSLTV